MNIENPAAFRFIIDEDLYLLKADKGFISTALPETEISEPIKIIPDIPKTPVIDFKYLGAHKKRFLIIVHYPGIDFINEEHLVSLQNILKRMELSMDDVAIFNLAGYSDITFEQINNHFKPEKLLVMGQSSLPAGIDNLILNQPKKETGRVTLFSLSFGEMMNSNEHKKAFWEQMKTL